MNKNILRLITIIPFSIMYGLMVKYIGYDITILLILIMIYVELFIKGDSNE